MNIILPEDNAISYYWEFGDGGTSTERNPIHIYRRAGVYTVKLTVLLATNQTREKYITVYIEEPDMFKSNRCFVLGLSGIEVEDGRNQQSVPNGN